MIQPVNRTYVMFILRGEIEYENEKKQLRKAQQAVLFNCAAIFDTTECELDWLPSECE